MGLQPTSGVPEASVPNAVPISSSHSQSPLCVVCNQPVTLEMAKTDETGRAVHDECYLQRVGSTA